MQRIGLLKPEQVKALRRLAVSFISFILVLACGSGVTADEPAVRLWIVTEKTPGDGMNRTLRDAVYAFSVSHSNVSVELEILPSGIESRNRRVQELHELMAQGEGPDVFLLPAKHSINTGTSIRGVEPLFSNIPYAMRQGKFADIAQYYNEDSELNKDALQQTVMDAGCVGEQRYLLPLSFDMNVFYFLSDGENAELKPEMTVLDVLQYGLRSNDPQLAWALTDAAAPRYRPEMIFSDLIDYDTGNVVISFEEVEQFFDTYQRLSLKVKSVEGYRDNVGLWEYFKTSTPNQAVLPCYLSSVSMAMTFSAIASMEGKTLTAIPMRASNGEVTAMVSYFGAVSANARYPKLGYAFLRTLLMPEYQWRVGVTGGVQMTDWSVRVGGSVEATWPEICSKFSSQKVRRTLEALNASDEWVTQITDQITRADFRVDINLTGALNQLAEDG